MVHGAPDNFQVRPKNITHTLDDDAELAIRLGAISSIDRLGNVIFSDDFSNGIGSWLKTELGIGADISIDGDIFKSGGFSCKITPRSDDPYLGSIYNQLHYPDVSKMGLEVNMSMDSYIDYILITLILYDGSWLHYTAIKIDITNNKLQYLDSTQVYQDIVGSVSFPNVTSIFHNFKLKVDFVDDYYINLRYNSELYNLSTLGMYTEAFVSHKHLRSQISVYSKAGENGNVYVDSIIVTRNEP